ncbi:MULTISPECIES: glutathione S-transferase family protein [unclassified Brevundimonas]|jgi:glutathione S-transferase|uniref:glutathione S-transferase family protein n=1 Tax=unclassified Brevundimonas TaxID=2622653 RepID=UPI0025C6CE5D|nr:MULTISPECIES: glutathione S-transferase family protein [unclassified Brevundimonas]
MPSPIEPELELVSHHLCPYVQRAAIVLAEKQVPFKRTLIDLASKPDWFSSLAPLGKVPLLRQGNTTLFESAAICEFLDEIYGPALHPRNPVERAQHRAWIAVASSVLDTISGLYNAPTEPAFEARRTELEARFSRVEDALHSGPYFRGSPFSLVDAAFAPVFRYFEVFDRHVSLATFAGKPKLGAWRQRLAERPSVRSAVDADYGDRLERFLSARPSHLSTLINALG